MKGSNKKEGLGQDLGCAPVIAEWTEALAVKPDDLSSIPETLVVGGKNRLLKIALCPP